jgi:hypothetical protein
MFATILEVLSTYYLMSIAWQIRDGVIAGIMFTAIIPIALSYMDLMGEHISVKMFMIVGLFFSMDLILIWTASLVH